jgi:uncharacterized protein YjbJ (UPF0337 family)
MSPRRELAWFIQEDGHVASVCKPSRKLCNNSGDEDSNPQRWAEMKDSTKDQVKGKADELVGKAKSKAGQATDDSDLEAEGKGQQLGGKVQKKAGEVKKVFNK